MTKIKDKAKYLAGNHYECEDSWYSCPKSEGGCANDLNGDECNCGVKRKIEKIAQAITEAHNEAVMECVKLIENIGYLSRSDVPTNIPNEKANGKGCFQLGFEQARKEDLKALQSLIKDPKETP